MRRSVAITLLTLLVLLTGWVTPLVATTQEATPPALPVTPGADVCTVDPRPLTFFEQFVGTPAAAPATQEAAGTPSVFVMPEGDPADPVTRAAVTATVLELAGCLNTGDRLRYYALFTDEYFHHLVAEVGPLPPEALASFATPQPLPEQSRAALLAVHIVRMLPSGHVGGLFDVFAPDVGGPARMYVEFVEQDGRWLVERQVIVSPLDSSQIGTPAA